MKLLQAVKTSIGAQRAFKQAVYIGEESSVCAGAVVIKDITEIGTYIGVPAVKK